MSEGIRSLLNYCYGDEGDYWVSKSKIMSFITEKEWERISKDLIGITMKIKGNESLIPKRDIIFGITKNSVYWD